MEKTTLTVDGQTVPYVLYLYNDDPLKCRNWLFALNVAATPAGRALAVRFREACYDMPKATKWFHQGGHCGRDEVSTWQMFEFWNPNEALILDAVMGVAEALGLEIQMGQALAEDLSHLDRNAA